MTMKKYLDLFEAAPMPTGSTAVPTSTPSTTAKPIPTLPGAANSATAKPVRPGDAAAYVGGPVDATAQIPDISKGIPGTGAKPVNSMQDFEEDIEETVEAELAEMMRLSGLPLNEKAVSKQQQKFMGMVHAMQKGEKVKGASAELKKAAKTMGKKDAKDFASTKHKGLPKKVTEDVMLDEGGNALKHIANRFKHEVKNFMNSGNMADNLFDALYDYYLDTGEMPYGIAKAREGDPYAWVEERFYADMGSGMSESAPVYEIASDDTLNELAILAGLEEGGPGQFGMPDTKSTVAKDKIQPAGPAKSVEPIAQFAADLGMPELPGKAFTDKERQDYRKIKADKKSGVDEDGPGAAVLQGQDKTTAGKMQSGTDSVKDFFTKGAEDYKDLYMTGLGMPPDKYTPADPRKPFGPKKSEVKEQDLNECGDMSMDQEDRMNVTTNMSTDGTKDVTINARGSKADELLQMLKMAGMRPHDDHDHEAMSEPAVIMIGSDEMMEQELEEARKKRTTRYVNTPDEEYQTVASITRQGNDLNREKKQFAGKPRLGDNPMAESALDVDLDAMLESILIREQDSKIEYDEVDQRVKADFPAPKRRDPASQEIPMEPEAPASRTTGPRSMKIPSERTGTEGYGKEEVDEQGSNQPNPYPIGQDALSPQEKLNPTNNPNKSIVRGIKDFIMNPLKPGM